ncbi:MAG: CDP-alcohol phosphatidyltransferase family protein [Nitriliruptoraceae bacterium]
MLDQRARAVLRPGLDRVARPLARWGVTPIVLTLAGFLVGLGSAGAAALAAWWLALGLWLVSRLLDGLDGAVARARGTVTDRGGYLDVVADFTVYGAFVVGCAIGQPDARMALLVLLLAYYVNGTAFLALSSALERRRQHTGLEDERSFVFSRGLAEGTETVVAHALFVTFPSVMPVLAWVFAGIVAVTVVQRVGVAIRALAP